MPSKYTHDAVLVLAVLEIRQKLVQNTVLALLTANVTRMAFHVVNPFEIVDGDPSVTGFVQLVERLLDHISPAFTHRWLRKEMILFIANFLSHMQYLYTFRLIV